MYAVCMTMPDLSYHVAHLARCMQAPSKKALLAAKRVLAYAYHRRHIPLTLGGTRERDMAFKRAADIKQNSHDQLEMFSDASFGGTKVKPMGGGFVRWRGSTVAWRACLMKFVPLSSAEAEVAAIVMMLKITLFVMMLLQDLGVAPPDAIQGYTDSKSGKDIVVNPGVTKHTAHFARWLHFAREHVLNGQLNLSHISDLLMMADDKTKALELRKVILCREFQLNAPLGSVSSEANTLSDSRGDLSGQSYHTT